MKEQRGKLGLGSDSKETPKGDVKGDLHGSATIKSYQCRLQRGGIAKREREEILTLGLRNAEVLSKSG